MAVIGTFGQFTTARALALPHLVQDIANLVEGVQLLVIGPQLGVLIAVADVQVGIPELGRPPGQDAVAHVGVKDVRVLPLAGRVEAHQVHPLPGVPLGIDVPMEDQAAQGGPPPEGQPRQADFRA